MRITKEQKIIYMGVFVNDCKKYVDELLNLQDIINVEEYNFTDEFNNYWEIRKSLIGESPKFIEIRINMYNHNAKINTSKLKGMRTCQQCWVYIKDTNRNLCNGFDYAKGRNDSVIVDNLSFQNYKFSLY